MKTIIKDMRGVNGTPNCSFLNNSSIREFQQNLNSTRNNTKRVVAQRVLGIIKEQGNSLRDFWDVAEKRPYRSGSDYTKRVDFWARKNSSNPAILFFSKEEREIVFPWFIYNDEAYCSSVLSGHRFIIPITNLLPLFPAAVREAGGYGIAHELTKTAEELNSLREEFHSKIKPSQYETLDDLNIDYNNNPFTEEKQEEDMSKETTVKSTLVETHKNVIKEVGYLNGGRASNKLMKEAVRPLLNAMFKPTFMQKLGMKVFNLKNPVEEALNHPASDFFCAELANLIVEIKGVENKHVRKVSQAGITYSSLELSRLIPFEEAMDKVVEHLEQGATKIVDKMEKK